MAKKNMKKSAMTQDELDRLKYKESFQEWFPVEKVENGFIIDRNGEYYPVLELGTVNLELKSKFEKADLGKRFESTLASFPFSEYQILIVPMPFDIEEWQLQVAERLRQLQEQGDEIASLIQKERRDLPSKKAELENEINEIKAKSKEYAFEYKDLKKLKDRGEILTEEQEERFGVLKKTLESQQIAITSKENAILGLQNHIEELQAYLNSLSFYKDHLSGQNRFVMKRIQSGEVVAQKAFFIPHFVTSGSTNLHFYLQQTDALVRKLADAIPGTRVCNNQEIRNLLFVLLNPLRKNLHKVKPKQSPVLMRTPQSQPQNNQGWR